MTTALEGGEGSASRRGRDLPPGKTRYPLYMGLGGRQGRSGRVENLTPPGFDPRTVQTVVSRYTDWVTLETLDYVYCSTEQVTIVGAVCMTIQQGVSSKVIYLDVCQTRHLKHFVRFKNSRVSSTLLLFKYFSSNRRYKCTQTWSFK